MFSLFSSQTFATIFQWIINHGYPIIFLGMIVEGNTIVTAASFAASLGYFNIIIVFVVAFLGEITCDFVWYTLGYFGRITLINKYGHFLKISIERIEKLRKFLDKHAGKVILLIKISPFISVPGLILVGSSHLPPKKFAKIISLIILPKLIIFMVIGHFFGFGYNAITKYIDRGIYGILIILVIVFLAFYFYKKTVTKIAKKIENQL